MSATFFWYDYETTGIDPQRDRVIQFAGVRTDLEMQEVAPPRTLYCRLADDVLPSPAAMLVSGISLDVLAKEGHCEAEFVHEINREFAEPDTCVVGYNSLRFDDEFTRQLLYRNLHDPYAREWQRGNSRWDIIDLVRMAHALRPEGILWPRTDEGVATFKLEELTRQNGLEHEKAHDALSDVRATIAMARLIRGKQPRLFDYYLRFRDKRFVNEQLSPLGKKAVVHISGRYPAAKGSLAVVLPLCRDPNNSNGIVVVNLLEDPSYLISLRAEEILDLLYRPSTELEAGEERLPVKTLHANRSPAVAPLNVLTEESCQRWGIDLALCDQRMRMIQRAAGLVERVQEALATNSFPLHDDPDLMLYQGGFFGDADKAAMAAVRECRPEELAGLRVEFRDPRLAEMLFRYRARNYPEHLTSEERRRWDRFRATRRLDSEARTAFVRELEALEAEHASVPERLAALGELRSYGEALLADVPEARATQARN